MKKRKFSLYMHTLDGHPAVYWPGEQICFAGGRAPLRLATSLGQIHRERRMSEKFRKSRSMLSDFNYGYCRWITTEDVWRKFLVKP